MQYTTNTEEETRDLGARLARQLRGGDIVLLTGELGAGKTAFVKGMAEAFGITATITSPTFTLMNVYQMRRGTATQEAGVPAREPIASLVHIDTYRLRSEQELIDIGIEEYLGSPDTVCVIEWPEPLASLLKNKKCIQVGLTHTSPTGRSITLQGVSLPPMPEAV